MLKLAHLPARGVLSVSGPDRVAFLQGLVSNDVAQVAPGGAVWAALLTAQGKWLADFFILANGDRLLLDCEREQAPMLVQKLSRYRLRAQVEVAATGLAVHAGWDGAAPELADAIVAPDPRLPEAGWRVLAPEPLNLEADDTDYDQHRLVLGLPDGSRDMEVEKTVLLEAGFDELNGISWTKGCYMGQELTARTRYRGLVKRRLVPVGSESPLPSPGTPILHEGVEVGAMRSSRDRLGLALLRIAHLHQPLYVDETKSIQPHLPGWMRLPEGDAP